MTQPAFSLNLQPMSVADYLASEESSPVRREYVGGYVYTAQAGASRAHNRICINVVTALDSVVSARGCHIYQSDMRLAMAEQQIYYYPDVMVVCESSSDSKTMQETAPCLLVEVLSPSTASLDRLAKYSAYTQLPSLETYLLIEQDIRKVYVYQRRHGWQAQELTGTGEISLPYLQTSLSLEQIYRQLELD